MVTYLIPAELLELLQRETETERGGSSRESVVEEVTGKMDSSGQRVVWTEEKQRTK